MKDKKTSKITSWQGFKDTQSPPQLACCGHSYPCCSPKMEKITSRRLFLLLTKSIKEIFLPLVFPVYSTTWQMPWLLFLLVTAKSL